MDPAALAGLCLLLARGQTAQPLPAGVNCPPPAPSRAAPPGPSARGGLAPLVAGQEAREAITRVAFAEAGNQGDSGLAAVVYTILNRAQDGRWGASVEAVVNARGQFEPVTRAGGDWRRLPPSTVAQRARIDTILNLALEGRLPDLTNGARYFQNPQIVAERATRGEVSEGLVDFGGTGPSAVIGAHSFYVDVRSTGGRGPRISASSSAPRGSSPSAWQAAGGPIFVGDNRAARAADPAPAPVTNGAGDGAVRATKVTDPGRAIFVVGPGLAAGLDQ
ncbi:cell wall hydrolase [Phenylobacterium aquaticum]|uniref:cell wall hydrolase n=1 Tax=Phenylobacterium aquaticum TaxID=1763816 RepID=UPI001F5C842B|nr:cell wall hydrolase [Phenylobacterium aquaticum]MCI3130955.1 cell wall hydrolase [Phenylobacterium aquaticum]